MDSTDGSAGNLVSGQRTLSVTRVPKRSLLADEVYAILRESMLTHRCAPGERLNLDRLTREMHVSNTPVRAALARLESEGLVIREPYRGFIVSPVVDSRAIAEGYDFRLLIEPTSAARAARRPQRDLIATLERLCDPGEVGALIAEKARPGLGDRDIAFHTAIAEAAGNRVISETLRALLNRMQVYRLPVHEMLHESAWDEHRAVLAAIRGGDADAAAAAMRAHLVNGNKRFRKAVA